MAGNLRRRSDLSEFPLRGFSVNPRVRSSGTLPSQRIGDNPARVQSLIRNASMSAKPTLPWHSPLYYREAHSLAAERVKFIDHEGRGILIIDFSRAELEMVRAVAAEALHVMQQRPAHSVLSLVEVEGIPFSTDALQVGGELT